MTKRSDLKSGASSRGQLDEKQQRRKERVILCFNIGFSLVIVLVLGMIMSALRQSNVPVVPPDSLVIKPDYPRHLVNFSLVDQSGQTVSRQDLDGKIVVVNFVFTTCTAVCPYVNEQMAKVQQLTAGRSDVRLLSLTLDPVDDTAPVLEKYGRTFGQDTRRWSFLTGDESAIHELVGTSFLSRDTTGAFAFMPGNFANSQRIVLVDPKGHVVSYFDGLNQQAASAVVDQIDKMKGS